MTSQTQLTWYGQSAFKITTPAGNVLLIDPWIENPVNPNGKDDVAKLTEVNLILLTHGHSDHVGQAVEIGKRTRAKLVATYDLAAAMTSVLGYPAELADNDSIGHFGGQLTLLDGDVTVCFVPAWHGSGVSKDDVSPPVYAGNPSGLVIGIRGGPTIYHTGDTCFFSDIARVSDYNKIDIMLVCIGDHFTMGPIRAADAVKLVQPQMVIPMHYATFPILTGTPEEFDRELKQRDLKTELRVVKVGETISVLQS
jgi:L-ascorbate metabolism protein UlaG (beta-lactamase superfamily)